MVMLHWVGDTATAYVLVKGLEMLFRATKYGY